MVPSPHCQSPSFRSAVSGANEYQGSRPVGVRRGEQGGHQGAFARAHDDRPLGPDGVEDGTDVVHALLHGSPSLDPLGEAHPPLVEQDEPRECREAIAERPVALVVEEDGEVGHRSLNEDQVDRAVAQGRVREVDVAI